MPTAHPTLSPIDPTLSPILSALSTLRVPAEPGEYDIHGQIASALSAAGLDFAHEYRLGPRCRVDFLVGRVGIEVKKGRPAAAALHRQLARYLAFDALDAVVVITQKHTPLPERIGGKPVIQISLNRLWGVALP